MSMSGPRERKFKRGWAVPMMMWKAHYFEREAAGLARSLCGLEGAAGGLFGEGSFPRCKRCQAAVSKRESERS